MGHPHALNLAKPKPKGRASIYSGTDKSTNKAAPVKVKKTSTKPVVYGNTNLKERDIRKVLFDGK